MKENRIPALLIGKGVRIRAAVAAEADAAFILSLRLDPEKSRHLNPTAGDLAAQIAWMKRMERDPDHRYVILEAGEGEPVGTMRVLLRPDGWFAVHSMIISDDAPPGTAVEIARTLWRFALAEGLPGGRFETRSENHRARSYIQWVGAVVVEDDGEFCHLEIDAERMRRFVAEGEASGS